MANHAKFVNPAVQLAIVGELLAMVILGSSNSLIGPILGAASSWLPRRAVGLHRALDAVLRAALGGARAADAGRHLGMLVRATGASEAPPEPKVDFPATAATRRSRGRAVSAPPVEIEGLQGVGALVATDNVTLNIRSAKPTR